MSSSSEQQRSQEIQHSSKEIESMSSSEAAPKGWSDLPKFLLLLIVLRLPHLSDFICFSAVCRSWSAFMGLLSSRYLSSRSPLLLIPNPSHPRFQSIDRPGADSIGVDPLLLLHPNPSNQEEEDDDISISIGYSHGHLILQILPTDPDIRLLLLDPFTGRRISIPSPPREEFPYIYCAATLSAPLSSPHCLLILLTFISVVYRRIGGNRNISSHDDENPYYIVRLRGRFDFSSVLPLKNQQTVYAINSTARKLLELDFSSSLCHAKTHKLKLSIDNDKCFDKYYLGPQLSELDGQLLLTLFVTKCDELKVARWLQVYRMDFGEWRWKKADYVMDEYALFVDACGARCPVFVPKSPTEGCGVRCNRLYIAEQQASTWREVEVGLNNNGLLIPPLTLPKTLLPRWPSPIWIYPSSTASPADDVLF